MVARAASAPLGSRIRLPCLHFCTSASAVACVEALRSSAPILWPRADWSTAAGKRVTPAAVVAEMVRAILAFYAWQAARAAIDVQSRPVREDRCREERLIEALRHADSQSVTGRGRLDADVRPVERADMEAGGGRLRAANRVVAVDDRVWRSALPPRRVRVRHAGVGHSWDAFGSHSKWKFIR